MKKIGILLVGCSISLSMMSQTVIAHNHVSKRHKAVPATFDKLSFVPKSGNHLKAGIVYKQKLDSTIEMIYSSDNNTWTNYNKEEYSYNAKGLNTLDVSSTWNSTKNIWETYSNNSYTYDNDGNNTLEIDKYLDGTEDSLVFSTNSTGNVDKENDYNFDGSSWSLTSASIETYTFNTNELPINKIVQDLDITTNNFINADSVLFVFKDSNLTSFIDYSWDIAHSKWKTTADTTIFNYDSNNNIAMFSTPITISIDVNSVPTDTVVPFKEVFTYNTAINSSELLLSESGLSNIFEYFIKQDEVIKTIGTIFKDGSWTEIDSISYYYSTTNIPSKSKLIASNDVTIYPNPAKTIFTITVKENATVQICNIQGILLASRILSSNESFSVHDLSAGLYFVTIKTGNEITTKRLLVE